jgi:S1-C subfamily serine protease
MAARTRPRSGDSAAVTVVTGEAVAGTIYGTAPFTVYPAMRNAVAGLQLIRLRGTDLADLIGVPDGLFVESVAPGPGYGSGLRRHDVLLTANDSVLTSVLVLQRIVNRASRDRSAVKLEVLRGKERRTIWLR